MDIEYQMGLCSRQVTSSSVKVFLNAMALTTPSNKLEYERTFFNEVFLPALQEFDRGRVSYDVQRRQWQLFRQRTIPQLCLSLCVDSFSATVAQVSLGISIKVNTLG